MSSHYTQGDVSADVEALIRGLLRRHPNLMFTCSAVSAELPRYNESDVRRTLILEAELGLLEPFISWRCEECDSPSRVALPEELPFGHCPSCEEEQRFERFLYFRATPALMRRINEEAEEADAKKDDAANEAVFDRIATASSSPQESDLATYELMERIAQATERSANATEQSASSNQTTAKAVTTIANDPTPQKSLKWAKIAGIGGIIAVVVAILVYFAQESHLWARLTRTGDFSPKVTQTSSPGAKHNK